VQMQRRLAQAPKNVGRENEASFSRPTFFGACARRLCICTGRNPRHLRK